MKSFLALERSATFTCRKKGVERKYLVYEGEEFVNYELVSQNDTTEEDGVKAELVINKWGEKYSFVSKAEQKLAYYDTAVLIVDGVPKIGTIIRNKLFQHSTMSSSRIMHLCLKDVYYAIDWEALGITQLNYPIALRFDLDSGITPTPSRESYITNEKTKQLIINRIKEVAGWFVDKYNTTVKEFPTFRESYIYLGKGSPTVYLNNNGSIAVDISYLLPYSAKPLLKPKVKGITMLDPSYYKPRKDDLFFEWIVVGYYDRVGKYRNTRIPNSLSNYFFIDGKNPVIVDSGMKGNVKDFLKKKYGKDTMFIRENPHKRILGSVNPLTGGWGSTYRAVLELGMRPKKDWKKYIAEWEFIRDQVASNFRDEKGCENSKEFTDWLDKKRELARSNRKAGIYKKLDKQKGDVTLSYLDPRVGYTGCYWNKGVYPLSKLEKNHYLTVMVDDTQKDKAKELWPIMRGEIKFAWVTKGEVKKINNPQFINFQQFMTRNCKPFLRLASAIAFQKLVEEFNIIKRNREDIFKKCLPDMLKDMEQLRGYIDKNLKQSVTTDVAASIITVAEEHDLYDKKLWDVYMRLKKQIEKYDFIVCLREPSSWNDDEKRRYNRTISQLLLFRMKYYNDLPENAEVVFKN